MYSCRWDWNLRGKGALGVSNLRLETSDCRGRQPELLTTLGGCRKGGAKEAAEKRPNTVILRSSGDEESRTASKTLRARFFAALRMTANELRMTALYGFSAAGSAPPFGSPFPGVARTAG
jgi:hypothetical protein